MKENNRNMKRLPPAMTGRVPEQYPWLSEDRFCDVCVVGGGLTGALCAIAAAESGLETVLITSDCAGFGGTAYSPGSAESDCGRTLTELDRVMELSDAMRLYDLGQQALDDLQNLCGRLDGESGNSGDASGFERRDVLLFSRNPTDVPLLEAEYIARRHSFPDCTFLSRKTAANAFAFDIAGGILSRAGGAALDPYALTHLCLKAARRHGAEIFEHTAAEDIRTPEKDGSVIVTTSTRRTIYADRLILATGSDGISSLPFRGQKRREFTVVSRAGSPAKPEGWTGKCILRDFGSGTGKGYSCCIRPDSGIAATADYPAGLLPLPFGRGRNAGAEYSGLTRRTRELLPDGSGFRALAAFTREFVTTPDGLPIAGTHDNYSGCIFALCAGYSGPVNSMMTATAAIADLKGCRMPDHGIFDPKRLF